MRKSSHRKTRNKNKAWLLQKILIPPLLKCAQWQEKNCKSYMKIKNYPVIPKRNVDNHRDQITGAWGTRSVYLWPQLRSVWVCYRRALMLAGGCASDAASFHTETRNWFFSEIYLNRLVIAYKQVRILKGYTLVVVILLILETSVCT